MERRYISGPCSVIINMREPVFLTKNGYGDMVVMSIKEYNRLQFEQEIITKLLEAEKEARSSTERHSHEEVFNNLRERLANEKNT